MTTSVIVALRFSGGSMLGTPFAMASLPVRPTAPEANARSTRSTDSSSSPSGGKGRGGVAATGISPLATRQMP